MKFAVDETKGVIGEEFSSHNVSQDLQVAKERIEKLYRPHMKFWSNYVNAVQDGSAFNLILKMKVRGLLDLTP